MNVAVRGDHMSFFVNQGLLPARDEETTRQVQFVVFKFHKLEKRGRLQGGVCVLISHTLVTLTKSGSSPNKVTWWVSLQIFGGSRSYHYRWPSGSNNSADTMRRFN